MIQFLLRLGLATMQHIRSSSTLWRATCSFPSYKSDIYRDYVRAQITDVNILQYIGTGSCLSIEYVDVRGHKGNKITAPFWQHDTLPFHLDGFATHCQFNANQGSVHSEDNFGFYGAYNRAFRCAETDDSTTQYWFGDNV